MKNKRNTILIAGGSGLVGKRLVKLLTEGGYHVNILSRAKRHSKNSALTFYQWNLDKEEIDIASLEADYIINLSGAGIADKRWTTARKKEILESRTKSSALIASTLKKHNISIQHYIGASAIGIYGSSDQDLLSENDPSSETEFMVDVCHQWEEAHELTRASTTEISILRIGIVLSTKGGALKEILKPHWKNGHILWKW